MKIYCCECDKDIQPWKCYGSKVYPHRKDLKDKVFYMCGTCENFVGTHKESKKPLGNIANKEIKNFTHKSKYKSQLCGDEIEISILVKDQKVIEMGYQCKSCIYCQASASLLSKLSINKTLTKIKELSEFVNNFFKL